MSELEVGQVVELSDGRIATIRFLGQLHVASGDWVGVELEDDSGKNDGSVQGERYFECEPKRGMFCRPTAVTVIEQPAPMQTTTNGNGLARKTGRPNSMAPAPGRRMSSVPDVGIGKRMSMNAASPSPVTRTSRPSSQIRVSIENLYRRGQQPDYIYSRLQSLLQSNSHPQVPQAPLPQEQVRHLTHEHHLYLLRSHDKA
jgi:CAP-Gly domain